MNQKQLLLGVLIIILAAILAVAGYLVYKQFNTSREQVSGQSETAGWKTYTNSQYGFEIKYPANWKFDLRGQEEPVFSFYKEGEMPLVPTHANMTQVSIFPRGLGVEGPLGEPTKVDKDLTGASEKVVLEYRLTNGQVRGYGIYFDNAPGAWDASAGFIWAEVKTENLQTTTVNGLPKVEVSGETNPEDLNTILKILSTFKFTNSADISKQDAVNLVRDLPEVQAWLRNYKVTDTPVKPIIEVDHETETVYVVHVYEINGDHTATHNWYDVDKKTGNIKAEF